MTADPGAKGSLTISCKALLSAPWGGGVLQLLNREKRLALALCGRAVAVAVLCVVLGSSAWGEELRLMGDDGPPHEGGDPWFDLDLSLSLRGAYVQSGSGSHYEAIAVPAIVLQHETLRGGYEFSGSAEISRSTIEETRLGALRAGFSGDYQLDSDTAVAGTLDLALTRDSAAEPGTSPTVAAEPQVFSGDGEIEVERALGQFVVAGRARASRTIYGPTRLIDMTEVDNTHQSNWIAGGGLRLGYRVTPILTAFIDGSVDHQWYDAVSPVYLLPFDATDYQARAGLAANWNGILEAEASLGYGLRRFVEPSLGEASSLLYDASVTFRPDETVEIGGAFTTTFGAPGPDSGGTARLEYAAAADVAYRVNPWLKLRAYADWFHAQLVGTADTDTGYSAGAGADYLLNEHMVLTADYVFSHGEATPDPPTDEHRVTLGVTFKR